MERPEYDVVVVGGRVAGAATGLMLARAGVRVAVVDRVRQPAPTLSTHILWPAAMRQLDRLGVYDAVAAAGAPEVSTVTLDVDGAAVAVPLPGAAHAPPVRAPRRTTLDPLLLDAAERAGATVQEGVTVEGLQRDGDRITGVAGRCGDGGSWQARARLVVGADGPRSVVARAVGAQVYEERPPTNAVHYAYWEGLEDRGYELWYRTEGLMAGVVPTDGGACVFVNCRADRLDELRRDRAAGYRGVLVRAAPGLDERLAAARRTSPVRGTPGTVAFRRVPHGPGWALVGDAGTTKDPASGHGITAALVEAEPAARAVVAALDGDADALAGYHVWRDQASAAHYAAAADMAAYRWDAAGIVALQVAFGEALAAEAEEVAGRAAWAGMPAAGGAAPAARRAA